MFNRIIGSPAIEVLPTLAGMAFVIVLWLWPLVYGVPLISVQ